MATSEHDALGETLEHGEGALPPLGGGDAEAPASVAAPVAAPEVAAETADAAEPTTPEPAAPTGEIEEARLQLSAVTAEILSIGDHESAIKAAAAERSAFILMKERTQEEWAMTEGGIEHRVNLARRQAQEKYARLQVLKKQAEELARKIERAG